MTFLGGFDDRHPPLLPDPNSDSHVSITILAANPEGTRNPAPVRSSSVSCRGSRAFPSTRAPGADFPVDPTALRFLVVGAGLWAVLSPAAVGDLVAGCLEELRRSAADDPADQAPAFTRHTRRGLWVCVWVGGGTENFVLRFCKVVFLQIFRFLTIDLMDTLASLTCEPSPARRWRVAPTRPRAPPSPPWPFGGPAPSTPPPAGAPSSRPRRPSPPPRGWAAQSVFPIKRGCAPCDNFMETQDY